jgi:hypothetical protein
LTTKISSGTKIPDLGQAIVEGIKGYGYIDKYGVDWNAPKNRLELMITTYGHWGYRYPFIYLPADMNGMKNKLSSGIPPISATTVNKQMKLVLNQDAAAANYLMSALYKVGGPSHSRCLFLC